MNATNSLLEAPSGNEFGFRNIYMIQRSYNYFGNSCMRFADDDSDDENANVLATFGMLRQISLIC